jgi:histidine kinase-like protein
VSPARSAPTEASAGRPGRRRVGDLEGQGQARLASVAGDRPERSLDELCDSIMAEMVGTSQPKDDVALLVLSFAAPAPDRFGFAGLTDPRQPGAVRHALGHWLKGAGATPAECNDLVLAASEAITNALMHAYGAGQALVGSVDVDSGASGTRVRLR